MGVAVGVTVFLAVSTTDLNAKLPAVGIQHHFTAAELRSLWEDPTPAKETYRALPAPIRHQVRNIVVDTANDALASALYVCAALVGAVGLGLAGLVAWRSRYRRRGNARAATSGFP
jgi:hypothetical protein